MPPEIHSLTDMLAVRDQCRDLLTKAPPEALAALTVLQDTLAYPARAEAWKAIASLRSAEAAGALAEILDSLETKPEIKALRTILHQLRSQGVKAPEPGARPVSPLPRNGAGRLELPLTTWVSCTDAAGAFVLVAHLKDRKKGMGGLATISALHGWRRADVFRASEKELVEELFVDLEDNGLPELHEIEPSTWLSFTDVAYPMDALASRDREDADRAEDPSRGPLDPSDPRGWMRLVKTIESVVAAEPVPEVSPATLEDLDAAADMLLASPDYDSWCVGIEDVGEDLARELLEYLDRPDDAEDEAALVRRSLKAMAASGQEALWEASLRHNARVHAAIRADDLAGIEIALADAFHRLPAAEHPFVRALARMAPDRVAGGDDLPDDAKNIWHEAWETRGWDTLEGFPEGPERLRMMDLVLNYFLMDEARHLIDWKAVERRLWGPSPGEFTGWFLGGARPRNILPLFFALWGYRRTRRSRTIAETLLQAGHDVPGEVREHWEARAASVPSIYQIIRVEEDGHAEFEDVLRGSRTVALTALTFEQEAFRYTVGIGCVVALKRLNWYVPLSEPLLPQAKGLLVDHLEQELARDRDAVTMDDLLRLRPEVLGRAYRALIEGSLRPRADQLSLDWVKDPEAKLPLRTMDGEEMRPLELFVRAAATARAPSLLAKDKRFERTGEGEYHLLSKDDLVLARLALESGGIRAFVASEERATKVIERLEKVGLRGPVERRRIAYQDLFPGGGGAHEEKGGAAGDAGGEPDEPPEIPPELLSQAVAGWLEKHYETWPDIPLPMFGGLTPKQAAKDPRHRQALIDLLREFEANPPPQVERAAMRRIVERIREKVGVRD